MTSKVFPFLVPNTSEKRIKTDVLTLSPNYDRKEQPDRIMCSFVSDNNTRRYVLFENKQVAIEYIITSDITTWFAIVEADIRVSVYMDFEQPKEKEMDFIENVKKLVGWFRCFLEGEVKADCTRDTEWLFFDASTVDKYSCHVHCPGIVFQTLAELNRVMKHFKWLMFEVFYKNFQGRFAPFFYKHTNGQIECILDFSVFNRHRNMRMPKQEKRKGRGNFLEPTYPPRLAQGLLAELISIGLPQPCDPRYATLPLMESVESKVWQDTGKQEDSTMEVDNDLFVDRWELIFLKRAVIWHFSREDFNEFFARTSKCRVVLYKSSCTNSNPTSFKFFITSRRKPLLFSILSTCNKTYLYILSVK